MWLVAADRGYHFASLQEATGYRELDMMVPL
jgi:hypothetical protein